jgi:prophage regulatory protein
MAALTRIGFDSMKFISMSELEEKGIRYSRAHIYRLIHAKKFPEPVRLGENRIAFVESEVDDWLTSKVAERDAKPEVV